MKVLACVTRVIDCSMKILFGRHGNGVSILSM